MFKDFGYVDGMKYLNKKTENNLNLLLSFGVYSNEFQIPEITYLTLINELNEAIDEDEDIDIDAHINFFNYLIKNAFHYYIVDKGLIEKSFAEELFSKHINEEKDLAPVLFDGEIFFNIKDIHNKVTNIYFKSLPLEDRVNYVINKMTKKELKTSNNGDTFEQKEIATNQSTYLILLFLLSKDFNDISYDDIKWATDSDNIPKFNFDFTLGSKKLTLGTTVEEDDNLRGKISELYNLARDTNLILFPKGIPKHEGLLGVEHYPSFLMQLINFKKVLILKGLPHIDMGSKPAKKFLSINNPKLIFDVPLDDIDETISKGIIEKLNKTYIKLTENRTLSEYKFLLHLFKIMSECNDNEDKDWTIKILLEAIRLRENGIEPTVNNIEKALLKRDKGIS